LSNEVKIFYSPTQFAGRSARFVASPLRAKIPSQKEGGISTAIPVPILIVPCG